MGIKKGEKRTWDIWETRKDREVRNITIGIRLSKEERARLDAVKKKINFTLADILLMGIERIEKGQYDI